MLEGLLHFEKKDGGTSSARAPSVRTGCSRGGVPGDADFDDPLDNAAGDDSRTGREGHGGGGGGASDTASVASDGPDDGVSDTHSVQFFISSFFG